MGCVKMIMNVFTITVKWSFWDLCVCDGVCRFSNWTITLFNFESNCVCLIWYKFLYKTADSRFYVLSNNCLKLISIRYSEAILEIWGYGATHFLNLFRATLVPKISVTKHKNAWTISNKCVRKFKTKGRKW